MSFGTSNNNFPHLMNVSKIGAMQNQPKTPQCALVESMK